jgi:DNA repair exonuclease SbcCD ATPase subunit
MRELQSKLIGTLARIEESAAQGNYSQLADLEIELERKTRRKEVLQRRADGAKLLYGLVGDYEKQSFAALSGPIQDLVNQWLQLLTESTYDALRIDDELKPDRVHVARYGEDLPWSSLSYGAKEQVVVLLRLAIGVLVSREGQNLVVIDDRLVNADPVRFKRLCLILQEAAETCQLVVATCNDTPYAGLGAHIIRVPSDGVGVEASA